MLKRAGLSVIQKQEIVKLIEIEKKTQNYVANLYNCDRTTISKILKDKEKWNSLDRKNQTLKKIRTPKYESLENAVFLWIATQRSENKPVHGYNIRQKALELAEKADIESFKASNRWFDRFLSSYELKYLRKLHGESGSLDLIYVEESLNKIKKELSGYQHQDIYNVDETGLFYECLPNGSYILQTENDIRGFKNSKKRVSLVFCTNADGSDKLKCTLINSSANPRCFSSIDRKNLPVNYEYNKNAWMTAKLFSDFLEQFDKHVKRKVILLMDNAAPHLLAIKETELINTKIVLLSPNTTSKLQPLDCGIIANFKSNYRKKLICRLFGKEGESRLSMLDVISINQIQTVFQAITSLSNLVSFLVLSKHKDFCQAEVLLLENLKEKLLVNSRVEKKQTDIRDYFYR